MSQIHHTAIIHPDAKISSGTLVGPYCVVGAEVEIGPDCCLHGHVTMMGPTKVGKRNEFYPYTSIGQRTQDLKYVGEPTYLEIGDNNCFREFVTINRATVQHGKTLVGSYGNFLAYAHIAHDCIVGDHVIFSNNATLAGHVTVGDYVIIGGLSAVHQFCRIGDHAMIGGCTKIVQDVPSFMIADGNPAEIRGVNQAGLERREFSMEAIKELRDAYKVIYRGGFNTAQAVEVLLNKYRDSDVVQNLLDFIKMSRRGIIK